MRCARRVGPRRLHRRAHVHLRALRHRKVHIDDLAHYGADVERPGALPRAPQFRRPAQPVEGV
eukprot:3328204-Pleurochrysis_carterae.AAC.1